MLIGGFQKSTLIDYPGKVACIIFTQGCVFRCKFCHNPELVNPKLFQRTIDEKVIFEFLEKRVGKLEAVVITGGEPTMHSDLLDVIKKIKALGYLVKLDTSGYLPNTVKELINNNLLDYIAMDIKAPLNKYESIVTIKAQINRIKESIELIKNSGVDYEFRTTILKELHSIDDIQEIAKEISGAKLYSLQKFIASKTLDPQMMNATTYNDDEFQEMKKRAETYVAKCIIR